MSNLLTMPAGTSTDQVVAIPAIIRKTHTKLASTEPRYFSVQERASSILFHPLIMAALDDCLNNIVAPKLASDLKLHSFINQPTVIMNKIIIDDTLQRNLDIDNIIKIISEFTPRKVSPVKLVQGMFDGQHTMYTESYYLNYDSQHTIVAVWLIVYTIYGADIANGIEFPALILEKASRGQVRLDFLMHNDPKRKYSTPCNAQELHEQYVMMSRVDKSNDSTATLHESIQASFEKFNAAFIFTKSKKKKDIVKNTTSRINEFVNYNENIRTLFLQYYAERVILGNTTGMQPKEQVVMFHIISELVKQNGEESITSDVIDALAKLFNDKWDNNYVPNSWGGIWDYVKDFYGKWNPDYKLEKEQAYKYIAKKVWPNVTDPLLKDLILYV